MNEDFLKLTNTAYKVIDFFPESDPLKNRAKDKALAIMDNLVLINEASGWASFQKEKTKAHLLEDIDMLLGYFWIAKSQGWLNSVNFLIIANEYEKIRKDIESLTELTKKLSSSAQDSAVIAKEQQTDFLDISERQKKIIEFLSNNEKAQVVDLQTIFPDITKRTIRRDLDELLQMGKIIRLGEFNQVFYKIIENFDPIKFVEA